MNRFINTMTRFLLLVLGVCALIESRGMWVSNEPHWKTVQFAGVLVLLVYEVCNND